MHLPEATGPHYKISSTASRTTRLTVETTFDNQQPALYIVSEIVFAARPAKERHHT